MVTTRIEDATELPGGPLVRGRGLRRAAPRPTTASISARPGSAVAMTPR